MIKSVKDRQGYKNQITDYLDDHLIKCEGCVDFYRNYIFDEPRDNKWAIRVPGATRGHIEVENGKVKEIVLYEDSFCYSQDVYNNLNIFIGMEIDL